MKLQSVLSALGVLAVLTTPLLAQPFLPPYNYDFELEGQCTTSVSSACLLVGPFTNLTTDGSQDWISDVGGTGSSGTGPSMDYNPGTSAGHYLYTETSGTVQGTSVELLSPLFDRTGVPFPRVSWWYHMLGNTMGTMHLDLLEQLNTGTDGVVATAGITFGSTSATFTPAHVGSQIIVSGSTMGNDGTYTIVNYVGPNAVDVDLPFVAAEASLAFTQQLLTQDITAPFTDNIDLWQQKIVNLPASLFIGGGNSNLFQVIIRGITGLSFSSDMAIDDFTYDQPPAEDTGVVAVDAPTPFVQSGMYPVSVTIANFGTTTQVSIPVEYTVDGGTPVSETYVGSIPFGTTDTYSFATLADLSAVGPHAITAYTLLPMDVTPGNDGASSGTYSQATVSLPYTQDFEGGPAEWASSGANDSWGFGTPAKTQIIGAASGVNCWVSGGLTGSYPNGEQSFVTGPYFDFTGTTLPSISLSIWVECENLWDGANVQTSIDNGLTWQDVGSFGDPNNWYNDNALEGAPGGSFQGWTGSAVTSTGTGGWVTAANIMPTLAGQSAVLIRVAFGTDGATVDEGFAFDDILVQDSPPPYPGTTASDLLLGTGVNGPAASGIGQYIKTATAFDNFVLQMSSPGGSYDLQPFVLLAQPFTTGTPPMGPIPTVWIDLNLPFAILIDFDPIFSQLIVPGGTSYGVVVPPGFIGQSFMFQGACVTPAFAVTDGYEIQIL